MVEGNAGYKSDNLAVSNAAVGFTIPVGTKAARAYCTIETAAVRWKYDGGTPIAGVGGGHLSNDGDEFSVEGLDNVKNFRVIRDTSTDANLFYTLENL